MIRCAIIFFSIGGLRILLHPCLVGDPDGESFVTLLFGILPDEGAKIRKHCQEPDTRTGKG
jgi:hypothetical protein